MQPMALTEEQRRRLEAVSSGASNPEPVIQPIVLTQEQKRRLATVLSAAFGFLHNHTKSGLDNHVKDCRERLGNRTNEAAHLEKDFRARVESEIGEANYKNLEQQIDQAFEKARESSQETTARTWGIRRSQKEEQEQGFCEIPWEQQQHFEVPQILHDLTNPIIPLPLQLSSELLCEMPMSISNNYHDLAGLEIDIQRFENLSTLFTNAAYFLVFLEYTTKAFPDGVFVLSTLTNQLSSINWGVLLSEVFTQTSGNKNIILVADLSVRAPRASFYQVIKRTQFDLLFSLLHSLLKSCSRILKRKLCRNPTLISDFFNSFP